MTPADKLGRYRGKRDFGRTPEPAGGRSAAAEPARPRFVVQRHRARRLHYDFRLEIDGVLVSWAVPKGPTLDPAVRRMAVHVEDHPIEYVDFEGVIPAGEYGGGDVIVWDRGTWEPHGDRRPGAAVAAGELHVELHGEKLRGRFVLVRTRRRTTAARSEWLLLHKRDEHAVDGLGPGGPPAVGAQRAHQRRGQGRPGPAVALRPAGRAQASIAGPASAGPGRDDELAALDDLGAQGTWEVFGRKLRVTNLDKVLFPGRGRRGAGHQARAARATPRGSRRPLLPYLAGRALNLHRYPERRRPPRASGTSSCPTTRRTGCRAGTTRRPTRARPRPTSSSTSRPRWCGRPTSARWSGTPGRRGPTDAAPADVRADRPRPRRADDAGTTCSCWPGCTAPRSSTSACRARPR